MKREIAIEIMGVLSDARDKLSGIERIASKIENREEFAFFMRSVLLAISEIEDGPVREIVKEYPDLAPSYMKL